MQTKIRKFLLTEEGLVHLRNEHEELTRVERAEVIERIQRAREFGDLAENSEYDAAKDEQSLLEARISDLEEILRSFQIVQPISQKGIVVIGSTVVVEMHDEIHEFSIVGSMEADPGESKISNES